MIRGLLHEACWLGGLDSLFEGAMLRFLQSLLRKDGVMHLWSNLFWRAQMGAWRAPARQHDAAEFLQHMLGKFTYTVDKLAVVWEARQPGDQDWLRTDGGQSAPWLLQPPLLAGGTQPLIKVTVQDMIDNWHHQGSVHAVMFGPEALIVQVGRFDYDAQSDRALKRHFQLLPEPFIEVPVFVRGTVTRSITYQLTSLILHRGETPESGHYYNLFYDVRDGCYRLADDGVRSRVVDDIEDYCKEIYLVLYQECR